MALDTLRHPCFSDAARHRFARIHLPVAPDCNIQCNFCRRVYDCANESRPGVTTAVLSPQQALRYLEAVLRKDPRITVVGIAGPGDPFATPERTLETLRLVRERHPEMLLCVASNGLAVAPYADDLASVKVSHVTLTVNAVDPAIGAKIYAWVRDGKRVYRGRIGAQLLWDRQAAAIRALKDRGITVKINTIIVPGVNDHHVVEIARQVAELGADIANCVPLYPVAGTEFAAVTAAGAETQWPPSARKWPSICPSWNTAPAAAPTRWGCWENRCGRRLKCACCNRPPCPRNPNDDRPYVAVTTLEGVLVNQHLGEAERDRRVWSG